MNNFVFNQIQQIKLAFFMSIQLNEESDIGFFAGACRLFFREDFLMKTALLGKGRRQKVPSLADRIINSWHGLSGAASPNKNRRRKPELSRCD